MDLTSLSLEQKVGQLFFIGIPGPELDAPTRELLDTVRPGGVCLFARNIKSREQTRKLNDDLTRYLANPLISVDQEGGLVDRLRRIMTPLPAAGLLKSVEDVQTLGRIVGEELSILAFNMDFAPVVDVVTEERGKVSNGLFNRPFGRSVADVVELAGAFNDEIRGHGILSCMKHFPGYGATRVDSHEELPVVEISETEFNKIDLEPYRQLLPKADSVMIAHSTYPNVRLQERDQSGKLLPSSLSKAFVTTLLREGLGFDRLVVTDDLEMGAIMNTYGIGEACKMAVLAGCDMLAICADPGRIVEGYQAVLAAAQGGVISEDRLNASMARIAKTKASVVDRYPFDEARLDALSAETADLVARVS
ncbi:MAG TPA: glycoside hydrolase family 3 N-terminal domain-containing protein [Pyrinomonadaceae bacterium]|jgi:beta-N-acetylhexosaminidase